jgi:hypothetical protein
VIQPRLVALPVREPPVRAADGDVHDQVEVLVKRRGVPARAVHAGDARGPRVLERLGLAVRVERRLGELTALPEGLVEADVEQRVQARVDGDAQPAGFALAMELVTMTMYEEGIGRRTSRSTRACTCATRR